MKFLIVHIICLLIFTINPLKADISIAIKDTQSVFCVSDSESEDSSDVYEETQEDDKNDSENVENNSDNNEDYPNNEMTD